MGISMGKNPKQSERDALLFNRILEALAHEPVDVVRQVDMMEPDGPFAFGHFEMWRICFRQSGFNMMVNYDPTMQKNLEDIARDCVKKLRQYMADREKKSLDLAYGYGLGHLEPVYIKTSGTKYPPKSVVPDHITDAMLTATPPNMVTKPPPQKSGYQQELQGRLDSWLN